jgi:hypothetical protein
MIIHLQHSGKEWFEGEKNVAQNLVALLCYVISIVQKNTIQSSGKYIELDDQCWTKGQYENVIT